MYSPKVSITSCHLSGREWIPRFQKSRGCCSKKVSSARFEAIEVSKGLAT